MVLAEDTVLPVVSEDRIRFDASHVKKKSKIELLFDAENKLLIEGKTYEYVQ